MTPSIDKLDKTIIVTYVDAMKMMEYTDGFCGCCKYDRYENWYDEGVAFFAKTGIYIMDGLLCTHEEPREYLRYCVAFDFTDKDVSHFTIYNYYSRDRVCDFSYAIKDNNINDPKINIRYYNKKMWDNLGGAFLNEEILEQNNAIHKSHDRAFDRAKNDKERNRIADESNEKVNRHTNEFMCKHTINFIYSTMFYFSEQEPKLIVNEIEQENKEVGTIELLSKKIKYKYKYTGYVNLTKTSVYKPIINESLEEKKRRKPNDRHVEKWSVRGHFRKVGDRKIWINPHYKGSGELEPRVYGLVPESEVGVMQKIFEIEREVMCAIHKNDKQKTEEVVAENVLLKQSETAIEVIEIEQPQVENIILPKDNIILDKENIFQKIIRIIKEKIQSIFNADTIET